ncbi:MAG: MBL fold metallo-hydrolase [Gammaproteobacteria bacterium]|nr:MBL fold metallo-hydrolase [Gammaproteobacteria bacterium]
MIEPKPAATVAVTRDADAGLEVLLLQRTHSAVFMPGVYVFPGGAVDDGDREPGLASRVHGIDEASANRMVGVPEDGLAYLMAAIRECFEEAGLLLADRARGALDAKDVELARLRRGLNAGEYTLARLCEELDLRLGADRMAYLSHWITPPGPPRRYDTRFFVVTAPPGQAASHDGVETVDHVWIQPEEALARNRRGELPLGTPTIGTLRLLAGFNNTEQLLHHARRQPAPATPEPIEVSGRDGPRLVHPEEPAYAEVAKLRDEGLGGAGYEVIPGVARALSRRVTRLTAPNPGVMTGPGTNTYLVDGGDALAVIDPGPELTPHLDAIVTTAARPINWILATHTHRDHSPAARELQRRTGARVLGMRPPEDGTQDREFAPDRVLHHGERLRIGDATLRAFHTPGHASNHLCYFLEEEQILFSGDHVMQGSTVVINPPDGHMGDYLRSLYELLREDIAYIAPGHGFLMGQPEAAIDRIITHRMARETRVLSSMKRHGAASEAHLLTEVYADVPAALHGVAARSLLAHLIKLQEEGVLNRSGSTWRLAPRVE